MSHLLPLLKTAPGGTWADGLMARKLLIPIFQLSLALLDPQVLKKGVLYFTERSPGLLGE